MRLDFSKKIKVQNEKRYLITKYLVFIIILIILSLLGLRFLFPSEEFYLDATAPEKNRNTIVGYTKEKNLAKFYATTQGSFSEVQIDIQTKEKLPQNPKVNIRNGYQAFFYPEGEPMGWRNGSLLKRQNNYYIISDGKLRQFSSESILGKLGFQKEAFQKVSEKDLKYNQPGKKISDKYPEHSVFKIENIYYQLIDNKLHPFVSEKAFLTQFPREAAIPKESKFLQNYPESEHFLGFISGTLLSFNGSVFLTSEENIFPIDDPVTFELSGYDWADLIPATSEEMSIYEEQDVFDITGVHPDGTLIFTKDKQKYYYIDNQTRKEFPTVNIQKNYANKSIITAEEKSLNSKEKCQLSDSNFSYGNIYSCKVSIDELDDILGKDWEFTVTPIDTQEKIELTFSRKINLYNFLDALGDVKNNIMLKYGFYE